MRRSIVRLSGCLMVVAVALPLSGSVCRPLDYPEDVFTCTPGDPTTCPSTMVCRQSLSASAPRCFRVTDFTACDTAPRDGRWCADPLSNADPAMLYECLGGQVVFQRLCPSHCVNGPQEGQAECAGETSGCDGDEVCGAGENALSCNDDCRAVAIAAGGRHTCVILADETLRCWGANDAGQLGVGDAQPRSIHVEPVSSPGEIQAVAVGGEHTCISYGLGAAQISCWGDNAFGQLGIGDASPIHEPGYHPGLPGTGWVTLAAGRRHTCTSAGSDVYCWGDDEVGQLGLGNSLSRQTEPVALGQSWSVVDLSLGEQHSCAVVNGAMPLCWGRNEFGQLGDNSGSDQSSPQPIQPTADFKRIAAGGRHTCAIDNNDAVWCWGDDSHGQLGNGPASIAPSPAPVAVSGPPTLASRVATGEQHSCAIFGTGAVWCWGDNQFGQLGVGDFTPRHTPLQVSGIDNATEVVAGRYHTCALLGRDTDTVYGLVQCWGRNDAGQLGDGTTSNQSFPITPTGR